MTFALDTSDNPVTGPATDRVILPVSVSDRSAENRTAGGYDQYWPIAVKA
jgi:hypothetical protein